MSQAKKRYEIVPVVAAPFEQIAYVAWRDGQSEAIVVDPGFDAEAIRRVLDQHGLQPVAILNTHGHADHIAGNGTLKQAYPEAALIIGRNEAPLLSSPELNLSAPFGFPLTSPPPDRLLEDGERIEAAGFTFEAREIVGHSPGSMVYICLDFEPAFVFVGDVIFAGSVGRTDFPGGSFERLRAGIHAKLFSLPRGTVLLPGHGPATTVGEEQQTNPYVGRGAGYL